jgi:hypothetical protein
MATKKAAPKKEQPMDSNAMWKWVYLIGVIAAGVLAAVAIQNDIVSWVLLLVAILSGIFFLDSDDVVNFGIRFLLLAAVAGAFGAVPAVGGYLSAFFGGVVGFLAPVGLTLLVVYFWKKYFSNMM